LRSGIAAPIVGPDHPSVQLPTNGYDVRIIQATTGEIIRTLTINPERRYRRTDAPTA
jgi:hypothetical protein